MGRLGPLGYTLNPIIALESATTAIVQQEIELMEVLTGCETQNRYHVYITTNTGQNVYLFKCKEQSTWCERNCCK